MATKSEAEQFLIWLHGQGDRYALLTALPNDLEWIGIARLLFHWTLRRGAIGDTEGYDDQWCYRTLERALEAVTEWAGRDFDGEPNGWHRHPRTGRRREDGDPDQESFRP